MENIEPLLGITKPAEGLNKPCQGNINGRKSFAAEGFNVKIPFISQAYTKAVAISFRQSHTGTRNLVIYHPRVVFTEDSKMCVFPYFQSIWNFSFYWFSWSRYLCQTYFHNNVNLKVYIIYNIDSYVTSLRKRFLVSTFVIMLRIIQCLIVY